MELSPMLIWFSAIINGRRKRKDIRNGGGTMLILIGLIVTLVVIALWVMATYNGLASDRLKVDNQWSQIDVQLKLRADMIPSLVDIVKGYAGHEKELIDSVTNARTKMMSAATVGEEMECSDSLSGSLSKLMAVAEDYPDLKANQNFLDLQQQLGTIEKRIADNRQFYNDTVMRYNNKLVVIPTKFIAGIFNFKARSFYQAHQSEREKIDISF
jgi:LemA protein